MIVQLRPGSKSVLDLALVLAWRSIPDVYHGLYTQHRENRPLTWQEHFKFWTSPNRATWCQFIIQIGEEGMPLRDVGYVQFGQMDHWKPEVAIVIGEVTLHGKGVGTIALKQALDWIKGRDKQAVHTTILKDNEKSIRLFEKVGFRRVGDAREGEWEYEIWLII